MRSGVTFLQSNYFWAAPKGKQLFKTNALLKKVLFKRSPVSMIAAN